MKPGRLQQPRIAIPAAARMSRTGSDRESGIAQEHFSGTAAWLETDFPWAEQVIIVGSPEAFRGTKKT
jgi:hypothetical protein